MQLKCIGVCCVALCCVVSVTSRPAVTESVPSPRQLYTSTPAAEAVTSPTTNDPSHARGGHGIFGEPMVSSLWLWMACDECVKRMLRNQLSLYS